MTGGVRVEPLSRRGGRKVLETRLNAGDVILLKDKTSKPFARR